MWAHSFSEPYKTGLVIASPVISALIASFWPICLDAATNKAKQVLLEREKVEAIKQMQRYVLRQQERLKDDSLSPDIRQQIQTHIEKVQNAIVRKDFETISDHVNN
jgi:hypothetical protein